MDQSSGNVFVLSAPSGAGKSTLVRRLLQEVPNLAFSISFTTRQPRHGELHGKDYFFVEDADFDRMLAEDDFIEWVQVYAHRYGTGKQWLRDQLARGMDILLDIETVGAQHVKAAIPDAVMMFLLPPSAEVLAQRLQGRGEDSSEQIRIRLDHARYEMQQYPHYDYLVVNDDLETAYRNLASIVFATRSRRERMDFRASSILSTF